MKRGYILITFRRLELLGHAQDTTHAESRGKLRLHGRKRGVGRRIYDSGSVVEGADDDRLTSSAWPSPEHDGRAAGISLDIVDELGTSLDGLASNTRWICYKAAVYIADLESRDIEACDYAEVRSCGRRPVRIHRLQHLRRERRQQQLRMAQVPSIHLSIARHLVLEQFFCFDCSYSILFMIHDD